MEKYNLNWLKEMKQQLLEGKSELVVKKMKEYIEKYPKDQYITSVFGQFLYKSNQQEKAKEILEPIGNTIYSAKKILKQINSTTRK